MIRLCDIFLQGFHIAFKSLLTSRRNLASGSRHLAFEAFFHRDVAGGQEFVDLHTEVSRRGACLFLEVGEVGFIHSGTRMDISCLVGNACRSMLPNLPNKKKTRIGGIY